METDLEFRVWLEGINLPPHLPEQWWKETKARAGRLESLFAGKYKVMKLSDQFGDEYGYHPPYDVFRMLPYVLRKLTEGGTSYGDEPLTRKMEDYERISDNPQLQMYLTDTMKRMDLLGLTTDRPVDVKSYIDAYSEYFHRSRRYGQSEYEGALEVARGSGVEEVVWNLEQCKEVLDALFEYIKLLKATGRYVAALLDRQQIRADAHWNSTTGKKLPDHKPVEILYHASPYCREIVAQGFKTQKELGRESLGGATDDAICFTANFRVAQAVASAFRDAINLSQGKIGIADIMRWTRGEGIDPKSAYKDWITDMRYRKQKLAKIKNPQDPRYRYVSTGEYNPRWDDLKARAFDLFKSYLTNTKIRYNPLFFGVQWDNFQHMDASNVGVIAAQCDMGTVVRYLESMEEFRVPVAGIKKIVKVITKF